MRRSTLVVLGVVLGWSLACGTETPPPEPAPAPDPAPDRDKHGKGRKGGHGGGGDEVVERWSGFLKDKFGAEPRGSWRLDLDADGNEEVAIKIARQLVIAPVGPGPKPQSWDALDVPLEKSEISVEKRGWAVDAVPELADHVPQRADVLKIGDGDAPLVVFRDRAGDDYAFAQVVPAALSEAAVEARKEHPDAFAIGKNNLLGKKGAEGESPLSQVFVGDFDADGKSELLVIEGQRTWRWVQGEKARFEAIDYDARRGVLARPRGRVESPSEKQPLELDRDAVELSIPETSSVLLYWKDDRWNKFTLGD